MSTAINTPMIPSKALGAATPGLPGPAAPVAGGGMEIGDILRVLKQRKLTIIVTTVLLYIGVVCGTFVAYRYFPKYTASAMVEVKPPPDQVFTPFERLANPQQMELQVLSEARKLKQLWLLQEVLALPEVKATHFFRSYDNDFQECLYDLYDDVGASAVRDTTLIRVSFAARKPDEAELIVNAILDQYVMRSQTSGQDRVTDKVKKMKDTQAKLSRDLATKRLEITNFRANTDVGALESQRDVTAIAIADLSRELTLLETEAVDYQTQLDAMGGQDSWELPVTPEMRLQVERDPILRFRREQVENAEIQIQALLQAGLLGENHRQMQLLEAQRALYQEAERARREELFDDLRAQQVEALEQGLARIRSKQSLLQEDLQAQSARQSDLDRNLQTYEGHVADRDRMEEQLAALEMQIREAEHTTRDTETLERLVIRQRAETPPEPTFPNVILFLGAGMMFSLGTGVGLAFLREFADKAVRTPVDVARHAHVSVLGSIPELDDEEADIDDIERAVRDAPRSLVAESFRQVRTNLLFSGPEETQRVLLVTSPGAGCGKSSVAVNMAVTLAQGGQSVLLVDCNFRRPFVRGAFNNTRAEGLSNLLVGQGSIEELVTKTDVPNLDVLSSGPLPPTPAELLSTGAMRSFINDAMSKYDRVIIDGPPVLLMSDALVLAVQVSGVIMVTRAAVNSKGALRRATEQLQRIGARVVGAVLNGVEVRPGGYFKRQYREFYEYTSDETIPPELPGAPAEEVAGDKLSSAVEDDPFEDLGKDDESEDRG